MNNDHSHNWPPYKKNLSQNNETAIEWIMSALDEEIIFDGGGYTLFIISAVIP